MPSFLERYGNTPLGEVFGDNTWVSIRDEGLRWLNLPPHDFLDYARGAERSPYDGVPDDPNVFRPGASFLLAQAHRIWVTLQKLDRHLSLDPRTVLLDLGAYPFVMDIAVRRYLKRPCRIIATSNQCPAPEAVSKFQELGIDLMLVNLDPFVRGPGAPLPGLSDTVPLPGSSVDLIVLAHVIEHLYHPMVILREASRVLRPGGKLLLTTDNAFLLGGFLNYLTGGTYLHEPVEGTAAMVFNDWRGHVRFYTEADLRTVLEATGFEVIDCELQEVVYNSVPEEYFAAPFLRMPRWRANLLTEFPQFRNETLVVAKKKAEPRRGS
jgi:SAM-dependent methyltransferase